LRIERDFFGEFYKKTVFGRPRRAAANFLGPTARRRPKLTARRRQHNDVGAQLYLELFLRHSFLNLGGSIWSCWGWERL